MGVLRIPLDEEHPVTPAITSADFTTRVGAVHHGRDRIDGVRARAPGSFNTAQDEEEIGGSLSADIRLGAPNREAQGTCSPAMFCFKALAYIPEPAAAGIG